MAKRRTDSAGRRNSAAGQPHRPSPPANERTARFHFAIPSDFAESRRVQEAIIAAVTEKQWDDDGLFAIRMALEEAMVNAIKHGNRLDPAKIVTVEAAIAQAEVTITIHDQGPGFDRAAVPDPTLEENLLKPSGRGILMIESYADRAVWTDSGRTLTLTKYRHPVAAGSPA